MKPLANKIAVVAGATRGAGRGIACMLGEAGATVYCTGRSIRGKSATNGRPETIEETAELVNQYGGVGLWAQVDYTIPEQVASLFTRVQAEQGRLDILINDIWGGDDLTEWGTPFWELDWGKGKTLLDRAIHTHLIASRYGAPLMVAQNSGLIIEITDGDDWRYRGNLFYDLAKTALIRLAQGMARELRETNITALALTPGFLRSEAMLERFGVTEANWQDGTAHDPHFIASETPFYVGRVVAALAADPNVKAKSGQAWASWTLAKEYGFVDMDGRQPDWGSYFAQLVADGLFAAE